jgi:hypothetical protein
MKHLLLMLMLSSTVMAQNAPVYVTLWFDTEDYILPQSDDAAKRLAEMLTRLGIKATFKIVGEKARVLEQRGRKDVITTLKKHEIGYHSNYHSIHPTPAEYLQNAEWDEGVAEFHRREISGVKDIQRIFGVTPSCYGQPGSSWGPQSYPALRQMGINVYLDEASHVGIDDQPFYYGGMLNIFKMRSSVCRMELFEENSVTKGKAGFSAAYEKLRAKGGGTISIYYHPCEWVHQEFWDGVNFSRGANPLRQDWKHPRTRTSEETEKAFRGFEEYVRFIKAQPGVQYVTASELQKIYEDRAKTRKLSFGELELLSQSLKKEISFQTINELTLSAADCFYLLSEYVLSSYAKPPAELPILSGPARQFVPSFLQTPKSVKYQDFMVAVDKVRAYYLSTNRIPSEVFIGSVRISPQDYLATLASLRACLEIRFAAFSSVGATCL